MFIRWVVEDRDRDSRRRKGIIQRAYDLLDGKSLPDYARDELKTNLDWLEKNLPTPKRFSKSSKANAAPLAICWLKASAAEHVRLMRYVARILDENAVLVTELQHERPGYIVYEDAHQVVAEPFQDTPT